jgi:hypothetical protein
MCRLKLCFLYFIDGKCEHMFPTMHTDPDYQIDICVSIHATTRTDFRLVFGSMF